MGIFSTIFGSSPKAGKSSSSNKAYDYLKGAYSPMVSGGTGAFGMTNDLLGVGGADNGAGSQAFHNYLDSTGYNFIRDEAMNGVTNAFAGRGMLRSGPAGKAFQDRAANLGKTYFDNYLGHLEKQSGLGLGAGGLIGNAGQTSTGTTGTSGSGGVLGAVASVLPFIFSDENTKDNIVETGGSFGGVPEITFEYRRGLGLPEGERVGVRAQDVERLRPDALGPRVEGYLTVDYGRLVA